MVHKGIPFAKTLPGFKDFSDHPFSCLLYEDGPERDLAVVALFRNAAGQNARMLCLCDDRQREPIRTALRRQGSPVQCGDCGGQELPVAELEEAGRLMFAPPRALSAGSRDPSPQSTAEWLRRAKVEAQALGFSGLRVFFEMSGAAIAWEEGWFDQVAAGLHEVTLEGDLVLLSAFDCGIVPAPVILEALRRYPAIVHGRQVFPNEYYLSSFRAETQPAPAGIVQRFLGWVCRFFCGEANRDEPRRPYRHRQVLDAIFEVAPIGLWLLDKSRRMVFANRNFCDMTGISADRFLQAGHYSEVMKPEEVIHCMISDTVAFNAEGPIRCEEVLTDGEGISHTCQIVKTKVMSAEKEVTGLLGLAIDVTSYRKAETELKQALALAEDSRDKIDNIIESIADGLIVTDTGNHIVLINEKARELLAIGAMELTGASINAAIRNLPLLNQINAIYDYDGGQALQTSFEEVYPEREAARFLQARTSLMRNNQNEVTGAITVLRDETCGRELDRVKGEFMSFAAHELRTPLTSIIGYLEFCLHPEDFGGFSAGQQHEFLVEINNKAELLAKLVSDLLDISRIEAGKPLPLDVRTIDIKRLVGKIVEQYGLHAPRHRFDIRFEEGFPGVLRADEDRLGQVLENLLSNAVKYAPEGSLVQILGGVDGGVCRVSVEDQGIGMTAEQVARIFDKFYRADSSNTAARGLGLGMSIARQIVERHGGHIAVESEKGRGTRVTFTVPAESGGPA
jgi:PAS domain S-box-containing protein